jgi:hypothetical protein
LFAVLALALTSGPAAAGFITFSASGLNAGAITPTVNAFRAAVGAPNNANTPGPLPGGRREINWDGVGGTTATAPAGTPFSGFQNTRGALFTTPGTGFVQATPAGLDTFFGRGDNLYDGIFEPFSLQRVFTPVGSTITDATFFIPGSGGTVPATVSAFGVIFSDVNSEDVTSLQLFDEDGDSLGSFFAPGISGTQTFSFLGLQANAGERIGRVRITSGNVALNATSDALDQVVMDDFIFAEPKAVSEPSSLALLGIGAVGLVALWRRKKRTA